jgi:phosphoribosyl-AMP cyclohydrolase
MKKSLQRIAAAALSLTLAAGAVPAIGLSNGYTGDVAYAAEQAAIITSQPKDVVVYEDGNATFTVEANADSYQWYYSKDGGASWVKLKGTSNSYTAKATEAKNGWIFHCVVTKNGASETSDGARLVYKKLITAQPQDVTVSLDKNATFSVEAADAEAFQWYYSKDNGATWTKVKKNGTDATYTIKATEERDGWLFNCKVTKGGATITSDAAKLTLGLITAQPNDAVITGEENVTFTVNANADSYQWYYSKDNGATWIKVKNNGTDASYTIKATEERFGWIFRCKVTKGDKTETSDSAKIIVKQIITKQPKNVTVSKEQNVTFTVEANNAVSYQWYYSKDKGATWTKVKNNGTDASYTIKATEERFGWYFMCKVSDGTTTVKSNTAKIVYKAPAEQTTTATTSVSPVVTTTTTTSTTKPISNADFTIDFTNPESADGAWHVKKGEDVDVYVYLTSTKKPAVGLSFAVESRAKVIDILNMAVAFNYSELYTNPASGECNGKTTDAKGNGTVADDDLLLYYTFSTKDLAPGVYPVTLSKSVILKQTDPPVEYSVNVISGKIVVE